MSTAHYLTYRTEIDGLRALAVIPVILFHAGFPGFSGGFVGVDVFFVISGYLITSIILREISVQDFSLMGFYERRARRILPALFTVVFSTSILSWVVLFPAHLENFGESVMATMLFSSNILFWQDGGYFGTANELKPLLHTWSLAVEEQFYIFYPLGLLLFWRFGRASVLVFIVFVALASFLLSDWASAHYLKANFFLLPTRAWELFIGALVAFWIQKVPLIRFVFTETGAIVGILLILAAVLLFDHDTPFPGRYAILPVLGTALFIRCATSTTHMGRLMGIRPIVFIGLISYSAYLWHQPLFALTRLASMDKPSLIIMVMLIVLTFFLAWLSWRFIETPFRRKSLVSSKAILVGSVSGAVALLIAGGVLVHSRGFSARFDDITLDLISTSEENGRGRNGCIPRSSMPDDGCVFNEGLDKSAILWGDSHGMALAEQLASELKKNDISLETLNSSGCTPVLYYERPARPGCESANLKAFGYLKSNHAPDTVILSSRWDFFFEGTVFNNLEGGVDHAAPISLRNLRDQQATLSQPEWMRIAFVDTIKELLKLGKSIVIVGMVPEAGWNVPRQLALMRRWGVKRETPLSTRYDAFLERNERFRTAVSQLESHTRVRVVFPDSLFCSSGDNGRCLLELDGKALYRDNNHLSYFGASLLSPRIASAVETLCQSGQLKSYSALSKREVSELRYVYQGESFLQSLLIVKGHK